MLLLKLVFWLSIALVFYTYLGYGLVLALVNRLRKRPARPHTDTADQPAVTLLIAAYNEVNILEDKVRNCRALQYPANKLKILFVTDGSDDGSPHFLANYPDVRVLHAPERKGKIAAVNRAMPFVDTPITVFTDANTSLNSDAIDLLVAALQPADIGAVAGAKRIRSEADGAAASTAGEGLYWRYESWLKEQDARLYSVVGAAGELFAIRTELFNALPTDTLLDDFMQTLLIAKQGWRVAYEAKAIAEEYASLDLFEETKRKIRISAGGFQSMLRLTDLLNPLRYGVLTFQYVSHRVLRWTLAPLALLLILVSNAILAYQGAELYQWLWAAQVGFYLWAGVGYGVRDKKVPIPGFFVPLYFCMMNACVYAGLFRFLRGRQSVRWERARRVELPF